MRKQFLWLLFGGLFLVPFVGCTTYGDNMWDSMVRHTELHIYAVERQLVEMHREIDYFVFNLDELDPNLYPPFVNH